MYVIKTLVALCLSSYLRQTKVIIILYIYSKRQIYFILNVALFNFPKIIKFFIAENNVRPPGTVTSARY